MYMFLYNLFSKRKLRKPRIQKDVMRTLVIWDMTHDY